MLTRQRPPPNNPPFTPACMTDCVRPLVLFAPVNLTFRIHSSSMPKASKPHGKKRPEYTISTISKFFAPYHRSNSSSTSDLPVVEILRKKCRPRKSVDFTRTSISANAVGSGQTRKLKAGSDGPFASQNCHDTSTIQPSPGASPSFMYWHPIYITTDALFFRSDPEAGGVVHKL